MEEGALILGVCEICVGTGPPPTARSAPDPPVQELIPSFSAD